MTEKKTLIYKVKRIESRFFLVVLQFVLFYEIWPLMEISFGSVAKCVFFDKFYDILSLKQV